MKTASTCADCAGCQWQHEGEGGWCYMFQSAPEQLPCAQHDKFEAERAAMSAALLKFPQLLPLIILGAVEGKN